MESTNFFHSTFSIWPWADLQTDHSNTERIKVQVKDLLSLCICTVLSHCSLLVLLQNFLFTVTFSCFPFLACRTNHTHLSKPTWISDSYEGLMLQNQMKNSKYSVFWTRTTFFFFCTKWLVSYRAKMIGFESVILPKEAIVCWLASFQTTKARNINYWYHIVPYG